MDWEPHNKKRLLTLGTDPVYLARKLEFNKIILSRFLKRVTRLELRMRIEFVSKSGTAIADTGYR